MATRRLVLVNPVNPVRAGLTVNRSSRFPPIGLGIIAALTPEPWEVSLIDENWEPFVYQEADLVGITAFTVSANRACAIAVLYRERGVPVLMGGIHASMCPEEALRFVDAVVIGEAEGVWPQVLADAESGHLQPVYRGEWSSLRVHHGRAATYSIQATCSPRCRPRAAARWTASSARSRPSTAIATYRRRPPDEVLAEIEIIPKKMLFFVDDNITAWHTPLRTVPG